MATSSSELIFLAKLAEKTERYEDMMTYMTTVVTTTTKEPTDEVHDLLFTAYKKVVRQLRFSWLELAPMVQQKNSKRAALAKSFQVKLESKLTTVCERMLELLDIYLLPVAVSSDSNVLYMKTKGDYYRYLAEIFVDDKRDNVVQHAMHAYQTAMDIAMVEHGPAHPLRLGLWLNLSVFHFEILTSADEACSLARQALDLVLAEDEKDICKESKQIIELLRKNISLWTS